MIERKCGSIIALGGNSALTSLSTHGAAVVASKHGLYGFIKTLAQALGPYGVRANLLNPGSIESDRANPEWYQDANNPTTSAAIKRIPFGRVGTAQEVANVAVFLASDLSSYITGDRICCDGGRSLSL
jgi:NAD(P)-dependent dehydrogenase (short-subunit alcohol dehydrogenase family)